MMGGRVRDRQDNATVIRTALCSAAHQTGTRTSLEPSPAPSLREGPEFCQGGWLAGLKEESSLEVQMGPKDGLRQLQRSTCPGVPSYLCGDILIWEERARPPAL